MVEQQAEMSLDEVLSSIKQMVIDKDPPVLELTDMISSDGTIVKVKNGQNESGERVDSENRNDLRDFLRLAQEKGKETEAVSGRNSDAEAGDSADKANIDSNFLLTGQQVATTRNSSIAIEEIIREVSGPIIKDWLDKNLLDIVKEVVSVEIRKMVNQR